MTRRLCGPSLGGTSASRSPRLFPALRCCPSLPAGGFRTSTVSTFPNTFAIVLPLICAFWMQLTRTNAVFSRTALVSRFCAEIQLSGKSSEFMQKALFSQKTDGARRTSQVEARGPHTIGRRGPGGARAAQGGPARPCGVAPSAGLRRPPSDYLSAST